MLKYIFKKVYLLYYYIRRTECLILILMKFNLYILYHFADVLNYKLLFYFKISLFQQKWLFFSYFVIEIDRELTQLKL